MIKESNEIWEKVRNNIKKECDSETAYSEKYLKPKTKSYNGKINTIFSNNKMQKDSQSICLSVILIDSVFIIGKNFYHQVFLEECKDVVKGKNMLEYITDELDISSDDSEENSDEKN